MREIEFLPEWYPRLRRRKRAVAIQSLVVLAVGATLALWLLLANRNVKAAEGSLIGVQAQLDKAKEDLRELDRLTQLKRQWDDQARMVGKLGWHVPSARLVDALDRVMPAEMAIIELSTETEQQERAATGLAAARGAPTQIERRIHVRVHGVAPTGVDVGNFLARLATVPYFSNITMAYSRDRTEAGHVMREFEVTFTINLDDVDR